MIGRRPEHDQARRGRRRRDVDGAHVRRGAAAIGIKGDCEHGIGPAATDDHVIEYGAVGSDPMRAVPEKNSTRLKRFSGSDAVAASGIDAPGVYVPPLAGCVRVTSGG